MSGDGAWHQSVPSFSTSKKANIVSRCSLTLLHDAKPMKIYGSVGVTDYLGTGMLVTLQMPPVP
jgi:hypothetical protein